MVLDRKIPPSFEKQFSFNLPPPEILALSNQLNLVWIKGAQDIIKLDFIYRAGKWLEPKAGVAYFTAQMLEKGSERYTAQQIAEILDYHGAQLEISAGSDFISVAVYTLSKNIPKILPVILDIIQQPNFPQEELSLLVDIFKQNLKVNSEKNSFLASKYFHKNIFGSTHPYGRSVEEADVNTITPEDLSLFFEKFFSPHEVYLTGNLSSNEFDLITSSLSKLKKKNTPVVTNANSTSGLQIEKIEKTESVQASIRMGRKLFTRSHSDYPAFLLLNHLLGGFFGSRLMKNIREEKGLTYGIYSSLTPHLQDGLFVIGTDVNNEKASLTIEEILKELKSLQKTLVPLSELELSKNHLLGSLQLEISNPFSITEKIKTTRLHQLSSDHYTNLFKIISSAQPAELQQLAKNYWQESDLFICQVG